MNDEWYTPPQIIRALGHFDLDPARGPECKNETAAKHYATDGLDRPWFGRVWLNPPFSNARPWILKMVEHGNGIALVFVRTDAKWFQDAIKAAGSVFLFHGRISFIRPDSTVSRCPLGCALIPFGAENRAAVAAAKLDGVLLDFTP